jgi:hypothetical protein
MEGSPARKSYRPELHYMRGPGPRWREKNAVPISSPSDLKLALPVSSWLIPIATVALSIAAITLALA